MKIVYAPEDGDSREFAFKPRRLFSFDSEAIEAVGGDVWSNWDGFLAALADTKGRALRAVLWHELRKEKPGLMFAEVVVRPGEISAYYDDEEIEEARALAADPNTPDEVRQGIWEALGKGDAQAPSEPSDSSTDSTSPATDSEA